MSKKIILYCSTLLRDSYRYMEDYFGSIAIKNFSHSSKIIRRINDQDFNRISELYQKCFNPDYFNEISRYSKIFRNSFYVYEIDEKIVAYAVYYIHIKFAGFSPVLEATAFSGGVDPNYRSKGIFLLINTEILKEFSNNNVQSVYACIRRNNSHSLNVHRKLGYDIIENNDKKCGQDYYKVRFKIK